jgi:hypothetical protein
MSDDPTLPPRQPNTFRTWLPRIWKAMREFTVKQPDAVLIAFFSMAAWFVVAVIF